MVSYILHKAQPVLYPFIKWYYKKARKLTKRGIKMTLLPSVFHPSFYLSTDILLDFALTHDLDQKKVLELGCGNGFISLYLATHTKAEIHASDINPHAIEGLNQNAQQLGLEIRSYESDLFDKIPIRDFDFILVNPPYFEKEIESVDEFAFFTGSDFKYFQNFYDQIFEQVLAGTICYLIFSENVNIDRVNEIAQNNTMRLQSVHEAVSMKEKFIIYKIFISK